MATVRPGRSLTGEMTGRESGVTSIMPPQAACNTACLKTGHARMRLFNASALSASFGGGSRVLTRSNGDRAGGVPTAGKCQIVQEGFAEGQAHIGPLGSQHGNVAGADQEVIEGQRGWHGAALRDGVAAVVAFSEREVGAADCDLGGAVHRGGSRDRSGDGQGQERDSVIAQETPRPYATREQDLVASDFATLRDDAADAASRHRQRAHRAVFNNDTAFGHERTGNRARRRIGARHVRLKACRCHRPNGWLRPAPRR